MGSPKGWQTFDTKPKDGQWVHVYAEKIEKPHYYFVLSYEWNGRLVERDVIPSGAIPLLWRPYPPEPRAHLIEYAKSITDEYIDQVDDDGDDEPHYIASTIRWRFDNGERTNECVFCGAKTHNLDLQFCPECNSQDKEIEGEPLNNTTHSEPATRLSE